VFWRIFLKIKTYYDPFIIHFCTSFGKKFDLTKDFSNQMFDIKIITYLGNQIIFVTLDIAILKKVLAISTQK